MASWTMHKPRHMVDKGWTTDTCDTITFHVVFCTDPPVLSMFSPYLNKSWYSIFIDVLAAHFATNIWFFPLLCYPRSTAYGVICLGIEGNWTVLAKYRNDFVIVYFCVACQYHRKQLSWNPVLLDRCIYYSFSGLLKWQHSDVNSICFPK